MSDTDPPDAPDRLVPLTLVIPKWARDALDEMSKAQSRKRSDFVRLWLIWIAKTRPPLPSPPDDD